MADETMKPNPADDGADGPGTVPGLTAEVQRLSAEVETLQGQIADLTDRLLRAHAEMDNIRKRGEREREETAKYAITKFARDVVGVADNFERAVQAVPAGAADEDPALKSLVEGVGMTEREFLNVLERHGVKRVHPKGEPFNPHQHQAMMEMHNPEVATGTILEVFQPGYVIDDRVLRPAMVVVAKGGPKAGKPVEPEDPADEPGTAAAEPDTPSPGNDSAA
jgi:molecular chaperone GrpE